MLAQGDPISGILEKLEVNYAGKLSKPSLTFHFITLMLFTAEKQNYLAEAPCVVIEQEMIEHLALQAEELNCPVPSIPFGIQ